MTRLSEMAKGGGCGCKLSPALLRSLLQRAGVGTDAPAELLVGARTADDAAVWRLDEETALIATTDFFSPLVDDARDFGRIAAANAISDVYAMGGAPLFALALAAMPKDALSEETIAAIFAGGRDTCARAGIVIAGGHSIDAAEPLYGLAVVGKAHPARLLTNAAARPGDALLLGKPLGIGVLTAAFKRQKLSAAEYDEMLATMLSLNQAGAKLAQLSGAHALTDITGFGILGHLAEMCDASACGAAIYFSRLPILPAAVRHVREGIVTGASARNWESVRDGVSLVGDFPDWRRDLLTDPQTSGGLLLSCAPQTVAAAKQIFTDCGQDAAEIGVITSGGGVVVSD